MSDIPRYTVKHGDFGGISQERDAAGPYVRWDDHQAEVERERALAHNTIHRATTARDDAQREAEHLRVVINSERLQIKELRADTKAAITLLTTQRDVAQREAERLKTEVNRLTDAGNHTASLNGSRFTDEDIWREAFFTLWAPYYLDCVKEGKMTCGDTADEALEAYRKRWPR